MSLTDQANENLFGYLDKQTKFSLMFFLLIILNQGVVMALLTVHATS